MSAHLNTRALIVLFYTAKDYLYGTRIIGFHV